MEFTSFPAAVYKNGESKLVHSDEDADAAEKDGWGERPTQLPAEKPSRRPSTEHPIAEPPPDARPKKKGE